jgi:hypothetical protein
MHHQNQHRRPAVELLESRKLLTSTVSGTIFNDANANGTKDTLEKGIANQRVFIDANFNGTWQAGEPFRMTDTNGNYSFVGVSAGVTRFMTETPSGTRRMLPSLPFYDVAVDGFNNYIARDFGYTTTGLIRGSVFNDINHDGRQQINEPALANVIVYVDKNNNGKFDANEKNRKTTASGAYRFNGLNPSPANYVIRVAVPAGKTITTPANKFYSVKLGSGKTISNLNFGLV